MAEAESTAMVACENEELARAEAGRAQEKAEELTAAVEVFKARIIDLEKQVIESSSSANLTTLKAEEVRVGVRVGVRAWIILFYMVRTRSNVN